MGTTLTYLYSVAPRLTSLTSSLSDSNHPGTLFSGAHYNSAGALLSTALGNGLNETRSYDSRLRLASIAVGAVYNVTIPSTNGYAPNGDILAANDSVNGNWTYTYDDFNRLKTSTQTGVQAYSYDYDRFGNRWHQNGPQSSQLAFDANNHIASGSGVAYDAAGNVTNDGFHSYMYDDESRLTGVDVSPGSPATPGRGTVTISGAEQRKNNCLAPVGRSSSPQVEQGVSPQSCPWIYDYGSVSITVNGYRQAVPFSQFSTASGIASSFINAFNGDPASPVTASGGATITFTSKQVGSGSNYGFSTSVTYDTRDFTQPSFAATPTGGTLTGGSNGTPPGTPNYFYDAEGRRIRKTTAGGTVDYIYDLAGHVVAEVSSAGGWNRGEVYAGGRHLATYMGGTGGSTYFTFADWLGNERVRTNPNGSIYSTWTNLPFGEGSSSPNPGTTHFTGKERDSESNLDYFGARYYGSTTGRFLTPDWEAVPTNVPYASFGDPQSLNLYGFVGNNPLSKTDPKGHVAGVDDATILVVGAVGFLAIGTYYYLSQPETQRSLSEAAHAAASAIGGLLQSENAEAKPKPGSANPNNAGRPFSESTKDKAREESENCVFCGKKTTREPGPDQSNIDHSIPKSRGGDNTIDNAQNTCRTCNLDKGTQTTQEYTQPDPAAIRRDQQQQQQFQQQQQQQPEKSE